MNKLVFLMILFGLASIATVGILAPEFDIIVQKLGVFHTEDVNLVGCICVNELGVTVPCGTVDLDPLCIPTPP